MADGSTRLVFTVYAVVFPVLVLAVFVWLLLAHPANLYSPTQFGAGTTIEAYVRALRREQRAETSQLRETMVKLAAASVEPEPADTSRAEIVAGIMTDFVEKSVVTVDRS